MKSISNNQYGLFDGTNTAGGSVGGSHGNTTTSTSLDKNGLCSIQAKDDFYNSYLGRETTSYYFNKAADYGTAEAQGTNVVDGLVVYNPVATVRDEMFNAAITFKDVPAATSQYGKRIKRSKEALSKILFRIGFLIQFG
jgi:hypothetical protein